MEFIDPKEWWSRWEGGWEQWEQEPLTEESKTSKKKKKRTKKDHCSRRGRVGKSEISGKSFGSS